MIIVGVHTVYSVGLVDEHWFDDYLVQPTWSIEILSNPSSY